MEHIYHSSKFDVLAKHGHGHGITTNIQDFDDKDRHGYDFIYHDYHDLVLTIHDDSCYFISVDESREPFLDDHHLLGPDWPSARDGAETLIQHTIERNETDVVRPTTLAAMRNKYQDLLADFHCAQKSVFEVIFEWEHPHHGHGHED
ncbi:uncharacterized protein [Littorina saxatilis]|uniref:uncharacterized protein isoform X2 n=1 Tax=Littorina saxatilis TaxID=31220 RepID=UPI0038B6557C